MTETQFLLTGSRSLPLFDPMALATDSSRLCCVVR